MVNVFDLIFGSQILPPFLYVRFFWEIFLSNSCVLLFFFGKDTFGTRCWTALYCRHYFAVFLTLMASRAHWTHTVPVGCMWWL